LTTNYRQRYDPGDGSGLVHEGGAVSSEGAVRRLAVVLPDVVERSSYGTPGFSVAGKLFARLHDQPGVLVCWRESWEDREALIACDPATCFTTDHCRGHASVLVRLDQVDNAELAELFSAAWQARAAQRLSSVADTKSDRRTVALAPGAEHQKHHVTS
jgi:hypothetical protein